MILPQLAVITSLTRPQNMPKMLEGLHRLSQYFSWAWYPEIIDRNNLIPVGTALNRCIRRVRYPNTWCIILDDDNSIHPGFAEAFSEAILGADDTVLIFKNQYNGKHLRACTAPNPKMAVGYIDIGQFGFQAKTGLEFPFKESQIIHSVTHNDTVDGFWAEDIVKAGKPYKLVDVPVYYNTQE